MAAPSNCWHSAPTSASVHIGALPAGARDMINLHQRVGDHGRASRKEPPAEISGYLAEPMHFDRSPRRIIVTGFFALP